MFQTDFKGYANDYELQIVKITVLTNVIQFLVVVVVLLVVVVVVGVVVAGLTDCRNCCNSARTSALLVVC